MFKNANPPGAPLSLPVPESCPSLPLIFFQLRGADSPDTIIQLYCGAATVAAVLCKGFPRMARGQSGVSHRGIGTEKCRCKQNGLLTSCCTAPWRMIWQLPPITVTLPNSELHCWRKTADDAGPPSGFACEMKNELNRKYVDKTFILMYLSRANHEWFILSLTPPPHIFCEV